MDGPLPIFKSQIPAFVEQFQIEQKILNIPEYKWLIEAYRLKLDKEAIEDILTEKDLMNYLVSSRIKKIVEDQFVRPSREGISLLLYQVTNDLPLIKPIEVQMKLENALNRKFKNS